MNLGPLRRTEDPSISYQLLQRFWSKVDRSVSGGCWQWIAARDGQGYGAFSLGSRSDGTDRIGLAHRIAFEFKHGKIPVGLQIDHLCRNRSCVNPAHMETVTSRENVLRGQGVTSRHAKQTECVRGHPLDGSNLLLSARTREGRRCRECNRLRGAARWTRLKQLRVV